VLRHIALPLCHTHDVIYNQFKFRREYAG